MSAANATGWALVRGRSAQTIRDILVAVGVAGVFGLPMLRGGVFFVDWRNHLWLVAKQTSYVREHLGPTFFVNTLDFGWFYPIYAFYGGTLYYLTALGGAAVGSPWVAYVGSYVLAIAAAFQGWTWLAPAFSWTVRARAVCLSRGAADAYGRGAWTEFIAISMLPLVLASGWSLLASRTARPFPAAMFVVAVVVLSGSHGITLLYGSIFVCAAFAAGLRLNPAAIRLPRLLLTAGLGVLAVSINGWFLVPLVTYLPTITRQTQIGLFFREFDTLGVLFSLVPTNPWAGSTPQLFVQARFRSSFQPWSLAAPPCSCSPRDSGSRRWPRWPGSRAFCTRFWRQAKSGPRCPT